jgi:energy-converting hydrogenase Eha subunit C
MSTPWAPQPSEQQSPSAIDKRQAEQPAGGEPLVLYIQQYAQRKAFIGIFFLLAIGVVLVIAAITDASSATTRIVFWAIGIVLLLMGVLGVVPIWRRAFRPQKTLTIDSDGLRRGDATGRTPSWSVQWSELTNVVVMRTVKRHLRDNSVRAPTSVYVELQLEPQEAGFRDRHPELERIRNKPDEFEYYRVVVDDFFKMTGAARRKAIEPLDDALRRFTPNVYGGVRQRSGTFISWGETERAHHPGRG